MFINLIYCLLFFIPVFSEESPEICFIKSQDFIEFTDGKKICGNIIYIPQLTFSFGNIDFSKDQLKEIHFLPDNKVAYITNHDLHYVSSIQENQFILFSTNQEKELKIPFNTHYIKNIQIGNNQKSSEKKPLFLVEFTNGDQLPVFLHGDSIHLSDDDKDLSISLNTLSNIKLGKSNKVSFFKNNSSQKIIFSFFKERFISVTLDTQTQSIRLPWKEIRQLKKIYKNEIDEETLHKGLEETTFSFLNEIEHSFYKIPLKLFKEPKAIFNDEIFSNTEIAFEDFKELLQNWSISKKEVKIDDVGENFDLKEVKEEELEVDSQIHFS